MSGLNGRSFFKILTGRTFNLRQLYAEECQFSIILGVQASLSR
jgi:hypothetical protein